MLFEWTLSTDSCFLCGLSGSPSCSNSLSFIKNLAVFFCAPVLSFCCFFDLHSIWSLWIMAIKIKRVWILWTWKFFLLAVMWLSFTVSHHGYCPPRDVNKNNRYETIVTHVHWACREWWRKNKLFPMVSITPRSLSPLRPALTLLLPLGLGDSSKCPSLSFSASVITPLPSSSCTLFQSLHLPRPSNPASAHVSPASVWVRRLTGAVFYQMWS